MATKQSRPQPNGLQDMGRRPGESLPAMVDSIDELKQGLLHVWHGMDQGIIDSAVDEWRLHLRACVRTTVDTIYFFLNGSQLHNDKAQAAQLIAVYM